MKYVSESFDPILNKVWYNLGTPYYEQGTGSAGDIKA